MNCFSTKQRLNFLTPLLIKFFTVPRRNSTYYVLQQTFFPRFSVLTLLTFLISISHESSIKFLRLTVDCFVGFLLNENAIEIEISCFLNQMVCRKKCEMNKQFFQIDFLIDGMQNGFFFKCSK